jgi:glutamate-1-semialdehyde 2,1-aminomutase
LQLSRAKHPSLSGHARIGRWLAALIPVSTTYDESAFSSAPTTRQQYRRAAPHGIHAALAALFAQRFARDRGTDRKRSRTASRICNSPARTACHFNSARMVREQLNDRRLSSHPRRGRDADRSGRQPLYDLTGSYGVNVFGYDFYKDCIERGSERVRELGPVLGARITR